MENITYQQELKYLINYNIKEQEKINLIENLYILANINFTNFIKNN